MSTHMLTQAEQQRERGGEHCADTVTRQWRTGTVVEGRWPLRAVLIHLPEEEEDRRRAALLLHRHRCLHASCC